MEEHEVMSSISLTVHRLACAYLLRHHQISTQKSRRRLCVELLRPVRLRPLLTPSPQDQPTCHSDPPHCGH